MRPHNNQASVVTVSEDDSRSVMTWLPARCLLDSGLQESFVLHMDETGHIISVEYGQASRQADPSPPAPFIQPQPTPATERRPNPCNRLIIYR